MARLGALLSLDDYGSSVERAAERHPLWKRLRMKAIGISDSVLKAAYGVTHVVRIGDGGLVAASVRQLRQARGVRQGAAMT
jgi:hypothetical protein